MIHPRAVLPSAPPKLGERTSGVLLHLTSLPGPHLSGDLGAPAHRFVDFLAAAGQRWWQWLPLGPPGYGGSPYSAVSAFALSPYLVDLDALAKDGLLGAADLTIPADPDPDHADLPAAEKLRDRALRRAFAAAQARARPEEQRAQEAFHARSGHWLPDYALFAALHRAHQGKVWTTWEAPLRRREPLALERARRELKDEIAFHETVQRWAHDQLQALRGYAHDKGIALLGDVPIFVAHDSADVWQGQELFRLDEDGAPEVVAGVPPDYFSLTGQRWGNPHYRWSAMADDGYRFWRDRVRVTLGRVDALRLDHFIGFVRAWTIPASCPTAEVGTWDPGPGAALFHAIRDELGLAPDAALPLVAEDLGLVTKEVSDLRDALQLPGMRVVQFAFGDDDASLGFLPHNHPRRAVVYTGTHDNDTAAGWFSHAPRHERRAALTYLDASPRHIAWALVRAALGSVADTAILPAQDLLGLGSTARMNTPATGGGNWRFRVRAGAMGRPLADKLARVTRLYGRSGEDPRALGAPASLGDFTEGP